jgi:hypothetical protein
VVLKTAVFRCFPLVGGPERPGARTNTRTNSAVPGPKDPEFGTQFSGWERSDHRSAFTRYINQSDHCFAVRWQPPAACRAGLDVPPADGSALVRNTYRSRFVPRESCEDRPVLDGWGVPRVGAFQARWLPYEAGC